MTVNPARTDLSGIVFVRSETTSRLGELKMGETAHAVVGEANALLEDAIAALGATPAPAISISQGSNDGARTLVVATRFGEAQLRLDAMGRGTGTPRRTRLRLGSLTIETPVPWTRPRPDDVRTLCAFSREAVRAVILHEPGDRYARETRARLAVVLADERGVCHAEATAPTPWAHGKLIRRFDGRPFGDQSTFLKARRAMQVSLTPGAMTSKGTIGPLLTIEPLTVRLSRGEIDAMETMRLVASAPAEDE